MVNYQDPATIAAEFGACHFLPGLQCLQADCPIFIRLFNSGTRQVLARREWHIYVSLSLTTVPPHHPPGDICVRNLDDPLLDGNFLLPLTMSGM